MPLGRSGASPYQRWLLRGIAGWSSKEQIETNNAMLRNVVEPIVRTASNFQHISILQGTKIYGVHLHPIPIPARERDVRKDHPNFFFNHEDYLPELGAQHGFDYTALRPQLVTGPTPGALNVLPAIGVYAAIRREVNTAPSTSPTCETDRSKSSRSDSFTDSPANALLVAAIGDRSCRTLSITPESGLTLHKSVQWPGIPETNEMPWALHGNVTAPAGLCMTAAAERMTKRSPSRVIGIAKPRLSTAALDRAELLLQG